MIPHVDGSSLDRQAAQEAARRELSRKPYSDAKPSLVYRAVNYVFEKIAEALGKATSATPGGAWGVLLIIVLALGLIALVVWRSKPSGVRRTDGGLFQLGDAMTAEGHRQQADQAAARGQWADAVRERLRAVARELEARGVVDPRPGRTADELAREAGDAVPSIAAPLTTGTRLFDDIWYGGRSADATSYATLVEVDRSVTAARLVRQ